MRVNLTSSTVCPWSVRRAAVLVLLLAAAIVAVPQAAVARVAHLNVAVGQVARPVPSSFLGVSVEYNELPRYESAGGDFARMLDVLRPPGDHARVDLRVGGESADSTVWGADSSQWIAPTYQQGHPYELTPAWMQGLGAVARAAHLGVRLDLNLAAHSPKMAAVVVAAARHALPRGSFSGFEIGDEADLYAAGLVGMTQAERGRPSQWAFSFGPSDYDSWFGRYASAVRSVFPAAKFDGPVVQSRSSAWIKRLLASPQSRYLSVVTAHTYPLFSACPGQGEPPPTATDYLKASASAAVARTETHLLKLTHAARRPVRLTEVGSAVCGGVAGQSDTFATALWAPDLLFNMMAVGIGGINIHMRADGLPNTALSYTPQGLFAEPLFYGMAMFARALGPHSKLVAVSRGGGSRGLDVWAVRRRDGSLRLLYINKSRQATSVTLRAGSNRPGWLQRLTAPSIYANNSVTLAGRRLGLDGRWTGTAVTKRVAARKRSYRVLVPAFSAALLGVPRG